MNRRVTEHQCSTGVGWYIDGLDAVVFLKTTFLSYFSRGGGQLR